MSVGQRGGILLNVVHTWCGTHNRKFDGWLEKTLFILWVHLSPLLVLNWDSVANTFLTSFLVHVTHSNPTMVFQPHHP